MLHLSARSLRIALFAAALLAAAAAPAAAQGPPPEFAPDTPGQSFVPGGQDQGGPIGEGGGGEDKKDSGDIKGPGGRDNGPGDGKKDDGKKDEDKGYGDKGYGDKGYGDKKDDDKRYGDKRYGDKKDDDKRYGDKRYGDKRYGDKRYGDKRGGYRHWGHDKGHFRKRDRAKLDYKLRVGRHWASKGHHHRPSSEAEGRFSVDRWNVSHQGWARDKGKGFTVVTFKHLRRGHGAKVEVFRIREGKVWTGFKRGGRFSKITVTVCKVLPGHHRKVAHACKTRIFSKSWH